MEASIELEEERTAIERHAKRKVLEAQLAEIEAEEAEAAARRERLRRAIEYARASLDTPPLQLDQVQVDVVMRNADAPTPPTAYSNSPTALNPPNTRRRSFVPPVKNEGALSPTGSEELADALIGARAPSPVFHPRANGAPALAPTLAPALTPAPTMSLATPPSSVFVPRVKPSPAQSPQSTKKLNQPLPFRSKECAPVSKRVNSPVNVPRAGPGPSLPSQPADKRRAYSSSWPAEQSHFASSSSSTPNGRAFEVAQSSSSSRPKTSGVGESVLRRLEKSQDVGWDQWDISALNVPDDLKTNYYFQNDNYAGELTLTRQLWFAAGRAWAADWATLKRANDKDKAKQHVAWLSTLFGQGYPFDFLRSFSIEQRKQLNRGRDVDISKYDKTELSLHFSLHLSREIAQLKQTLLPIGATPLPEGIRAPREEANTSLPDGPGRSTAEAAALATALQVAANASNGIQTSEQRRADMFLQHGEGAYYGRLCMVCASTELNPTHQICKATRLVTTNEPAYVKRHGRNAVVAVDDPRPNPKSLCFDFNLGICQKEPGTCPNKHICSFCGLQHTARQCHKAPQE